MLGGQGSRRTRRSARKRGARLLCSPSTPAWQRRTHGAKARPPQPRAHLLEPARGGSAKPGLLRHEAHAQPPVAHLTPPPRLHPTRRLPRPPPPPAAAPQPTPRAHMGQPHSAERARRDELALRFIPEAEGRVRCLRAAAAAEKAAGRPAEPGSQQALYLAAHAHLCQLEIEFINIRSRLGGCRQCLLRRPRASVPPARVPAQPCCQLIPAIANGLPSLPSSALPPLQRFCTTPAASLVDLPPRCLIPPPAGKVRSLAWPRCYARSWPASQLAGHGCARPRVGGPGASVADNLAPFPPWLQRWRHVPRQRHSLRQSPARLRAAAALWAGSRATTATSRWCQTRRRHQVSSWQRRHRCCLLGRGRRRPACDGG